MKINHIKFWKEDLKLTRPYTIAYETIDSVENLFVIFEAENGITGIGAGSPAQEVTGETMEKSLEALEALEPLFKGKDIRNANFLLRSLQSTMANTPAAMAATDIALYDLVGKALGLPLVDILGRAHESLPTSITIGIMPLDETFEEAKEYVGRGFTILKMKTGLNLEQDIERVLKIREYFGPDIRIRVDANQGYSSEDFIRFFEQTKFCVEFSEQPLKYGQLKEMQSLDQSMRLLSAADESLLTPADVPALLQEPRPFGIFNIKLMKCGGMRPGLDIARLAHLSGIDLMWGCMDESIVSIAGALHAALASPATRYLDLDGSLDLAKDIVAGGFILENGNLRTTEQPGLGVKKI